MPQGSTKPSSLPEHREQSGGPGQGINLDHTSPLPITGQTAELGLRSHETQTDVKAHKHLVKAARRTLMDAQIPIRYLWGTGSTHGASLGVAECYLVIATFRASFTGPHLASNRGPCRRCVHKSIDKDLRA
jgi:hypothetical protein